MTHAARLQVLGTWVVILGSCVAAVGQPAATPSGLRADVRPLSPLFPPDGPLWVRFTLANTGDEAVNVPVAELARDGARGLPTQLVWGSSTAPGVWIAREGDDAPIAAVTPPTTSTTSSDATLVLAPHSSFGVDLDLRAAFTPLRYPGSYRVEWRSATGLHATAVTTLHVEARYDAVIVLDEGKLQFELFYDQAPLNVGNFIELARSSFYDRKTLHQVTPGFVIQGGCPKGDGTGIRLDGKLIPDERWDHPVSAGTLLMSLKMERDVHGDPQVVPNSASCQFFIALDRLDWLDGQYTVIGQARDAATLQTLEQLAKTPTDKFGRPLRPLLIRSVNLVSPDSQRTTRLELKDTQTPPPSAPTPATTQQPVAKPVPSAGPVEEMPQVNRPGR